MHRQLLTGVAAGVLWLLLFWLFLGTTPPIDWGNDVQNLWRGLHIPAWIVAFLIDGNPHGGGAGPVLLGVFLQWFVAGWIGSWIWNRTRGR